MAFSSLLEMSLSVPKRKSRTTFQIYPWSVGQMVSETFFGHSKVVFSPLCLRNSARDQDQDKGGHLAHLLRPIFRLVLWTRHLKNHNKNASPAFAQLTSGWGEHWATTGDEERIQTESVSNCLACYIGALVAPEVPFIRQNYHFWIQEHLSFCNEQS